MPSQDYEIAGILHTASYIHQHHIAQRILEEQRQDLEALKNC